MFFIHICPDSFCMRDIPPVEQVQTKNKCCPYKKLKVLTVKDSLSYLLVSTVAECKINENNRLWNKPRR